jgi:hypothetical protein
MSCISFGVIRKSASYLASGILHYDSTPVLHCAPANCSIFERGNKYYSTVLVEYSSTRLLRVSLSYSFLLSPATGNTVVVPGTVVVWRLQFFRFFDSTPKKVVVAFQFSTVLLSIQYYSIIVILPHN